MQQVAHIPSFARTPQTVKTIARTLVLSSMISLFALPSYAQLTGQDFEHQRRTNEISDCENRSGYYWSGTFENGRCVQSSSSKNSGGSGFFGALVLAVIGAGICYATDCLED